MAVRKPRKNRMLREGVLRPSLPFVLVIVGAVVILLAGAATLGYVSTAGTTVATLFVAKYNINIPIAVISRAILASASIGIISGLVLIGVAINLNSHKKGKVVASAIIGLAFSLLSLLNGGGFYLGFVLTFVGSLLAIIYSR
ncbi:MAG: hypothetical protein QXK65_01300 [Candidatus Micrarchaeaceae archaeon]